MTVECVAIIAILLMVSIAYHRAKKFGYTLLCLVLVILPAVHLAGNLFFRQNLYWCVTADVVGVALTMLLIGVLNPEIEKRSIRIMVDIIAVLYTIILFYLLNATRFPML